MTNYWVKTPKWLTRLFPVGLTWSMPPEQQPAVYLTFDDGPHPRATPFVLEQLEKYNARATFFCIGKNVDDHPAIYQQLIENGHTTANHTYNHQNGWKTPSRPYFKNILKASFVIKSRSFRPPYGRIKMSQVRKLYKARPSWKIYMWDVLSGDFDVNISPEKCAENVLVNIEPGSIVVFHDSEKAWDRMSYALPKVLEYCKQKNWQVKALPAY
jgi:peptidoglycan/xylan/chitin deacetylase (PgdA/CDA1 family)